MEEKNALLIMTDTDNIAIAIRKIDPGETVSDTRNKVSLKAVEEIPFGFKIALRDIEQDAPIYKYGEPIGKASAPIGAGQMVHVHNIVGLRAGGNR